MKSFDFILDFLANIQPFLIYVRLFSSTATLGINYYNVTLQNFTLPVLMRPFFFNLILNKEAADMKTSNVPNIIKCRSLFQQKIARATRVAN